MIIPQAFTAILLMCLKIHIASAYSEVLIRKYGQRKCVSCKPSPRTSLPVTEDFGLSSSGSSPKSALSDAQSLTTEKIGVVLLNLGGPESTEDVEGFLYNLFADPDIIRLPPLFSAFQGLIATFISKRRAPKSSAAYKSIGGGSPIVKYTRSQASQIQDKLFQLGINAKCYIAMRYWHPFTEEALEEIEMDGINQLVVVPLYPQFSISTSGSSLRALQEQFSLKSEKWGNEPMRHTVIPHWYDRPGYVRTVAKLIQNELEKFTLMEREQGPLNVLFSAHGVPKSYIDVGDPYQKQIEQCVDLISKEYSSEVITHLSYQSRVGPIEWLRPYTDDKILELASQGVKNLAVVPISFVSEHIETLEEIDMEYRELAEENGITNWRRVPALNLDTDFTDDLALMVKEALENPAFTVAEACAQNNCASTPDDSLLPVSRKSGQRLFSEAAFTVGLGFDLISGKGLLHLLGVM